MADITVKVMFTAGIEFLNISKVSKNKVSAPDDHERISLKTYAYSGN